MLVKNPNPNLTATYDKPYSLNNEEQLKEYLMGLSFPVDICEVYKRIGEITKENPKQYPKFTLRIRCKDKIAGELILNRGVLQKAIVSRDGKKITVDKKSDWSYENNGVSIEKKQGLTNIHLTSVSIENLSKFDSISDQFIKAEEEIRTLPGFSKRKK